jgi:hypothetical protein
MIAPIFKAKSSPIKNSIGNYFTVNDLRIILFVFWTFLFEFTVIQSYEPIISKVVKENASKYGNIKTNFCGIK